MAVIGVYKGLMRTLLAGFVEIEIVRVNKLAGRVN